MSIVFLVKSFSLIFLQEIKKNKLKGTLGIKKYKASKQLFWSLLDHDCIL
jgi:hypothetical protein